VLVAPATARLLSAYASGYSHDLLTNVLIATRAPVVLCPAMHTEMWEHPAVRANIATLRARGAHLVEPEEGRLAGGDSGAGRLAAPARIVAEVQALLARGADLAGLHVVVSAGGTREPIDAVRVIANRSSGKQGYALAAEAIARGARVTLVSTVDLPAPAGVDVRSVQTAAEMEVAMGDVAAQADVVLMAAAVADYRPAAPATGKLKKDQGPPQIVLEPTPDILAGLGARKPAGQVLVGFAAETSDLVANAEAKLARKNLDLIVANDVGAPGVGFQHDTNAVTLLQAGGQMNTVTLTDKRAVAKAVLDTVVRIRAASADHRPRKQTEQA
jgi:phosphopantothenoylcysteine decarboxylase/phosphopantothenate--cysteine ligase